MKVSFDICPCDYHFFSREDNYARLRFKGVSEKDNGFDLFARVRIFSEQTGADITGYIDYKPLCGEFDFEIKVPCGYDYRILFELCRCNDYNWISYRKIINHIAVGDVFVIAGQSNAVGYASGRYENKTDERIYNYKLSDTWAVASHPLHSLNGYTGSIPRDSGEYSPHITMAKAVISRTGIPIAFIPAAVGGTSIERWNKRYKGDLYFDMIRRIKKSGVRVSAIIWYQGETDARNNDLCLQYHKNFSEMISDIRNELNDNELKFFVYQIKVSSEDNPDYYNGSLKVREAQRAVAAEDENVYLIPTCGAGTMEDNLHINPDGADLIGRRMAGVISEKLYKNNINYNVPTALKAEKTSDKNIKLEFNKETHFAHSDSGNVIYDITVKDDNGNNPVIETKAKDNSIYIKTEREIENGAVISGDTIPGSKGDIPCDFYSGLPMTGFSLNIK